MSTIIHTGIGNENVVAAAADSLASSGTDDKVVVDIPVSIGKRLFRFQINQGEDARAATESFLDTIRSSLDAEIKQSMPIVVPVMLRDKQQDNSTRSLELSLKAGDSISKKVSAFIETHQLAQDARDMLEEEVANRLLQMGMAPLIEVPLMLDNEEVLMPIFGNEPLHFSINLFSRQKGLSAEMSEILAREASLRLSQSGVLPIAELDIGLRKRTVDGSYSDSAQVKKLYMFRILKRRIASGMMKYTPFATVVTDFATCHTTWFHKDVQKVFVPTQGIANIAKRLGVKQHQIVMRGLPIRPDFSGIKLSKDSLRRNLSLKRNVPTVLMVGGGEGMGPVEKTTVALANRLGAKGQIIVICGRNEKLATRLKSLSYGETNVKVCGFVNNMVDFMCASDCIITKAGPGTIAEALICGLPMILNDYIPCQEADNVPYVLDHGVGIFMKDPEVVALTVAHWFSPEGSQELKEMAKKAKDLGRPEATFRIVEDLAALIPA